GRGEIDQHVALSRQRQRIAALVDAAGQRFTRRRDGCGDRLAHAPLAADDSDTRHLHVPFRACFMAAMKDIRNIVILTGAGVSAESGIDTFRTEGGLWERYRPEDVATPEAFARDPDLVLGFYDMRRAAIQDKQPNAAHVALGRLDAGWAGGLLVVTQ